MSLVSLEVAGDTGYFLLTAQNRVQPESGSTTQSARHNATVWRMDLIRSNGERVTHTVARRNRGEQA